MTLGEERPSQYPEVDKKEFLRNMLGGKLTAKRKDRSTPRF